MEELCKFLTFKKKESIAIIVLMTAILVFVWVSVFHEPKPGGDGVALHNLDSLLALRQAAVEEQRHRPSEPVLKVARPRPAVASKDKHPRSPYHYEKTTWEPPVIPTVDLNTVDSATLVALPQIGPYSAMRIIEYRERLGGYVDLEQLREVKGMDSTRFAVASPYMTIGPAEPRAIDVNRDDFKTLVHHPYLTYGQVKRIFRQREQRGMIKNWAQLEALIQDDGEVNPMLRFYVKY